MASTAPTHQGSHDPDGPGFDVPRYAVAGIRCALAARVPSIAWTGGDLGASFRAARPSRELLCVSAAHPYADLVAAAREPSSAWIAWSDIDSSQRLRRVRWALAEAGRRGRVVLVSPSVPAPGSWPVHARRAALQDARRRLEAAGARAPGRLAALIDLEPEAVELAAALLEHGEDEGALERAVVDAADPGVEIARVAAQRGLVSLEAVACGDALPPILRAFGRDPRVASLREARLGALGERLRRGEAVSPEELAWWSARAHEEVDVDLAARLPLPGGATGDLAAVWLRSTLITATRRRGRGVEPANGAAAAAAWSALTGAAVEAGDPEAAARWAARAMSADRACAASLIAVGQALAQRGRFQEASERFRRAIAASGDDARRAASARYHLAGCVLVLGDRAEAEALLAEALAIQEQVLGPAHPARAATLHNLGVVLHSRGEHARAESLLGEALAIQEQALGAAHPGISATLQNLGVVLQSRGRHAEAVSALERALAIEDRAPAPALTTRAAVLHSLALVLRSQGKLAGAEARLREALSLREQALGTEHPATIVSRVALAGVLESQGMYPDAEALLREALALREQALGGEHPLCGDVLYALSGVLSKQGKDAECEEALRRSLAIDEETLGAEHVALCPTLASLAALLARQGRSTVGEALLDRAAAIAHKAHGTEHPTAGQILFVRAQVQAARQSPDAAETAREALDILCRTLGPAHAVTRRAAPDLFAIGLHAWLTEAASVFRSGRLLPASERLAALADTAEQAGARSPEASARGLLAQVLFEMGYTQRAILQALRALDIAVEDNDADAVRFFKELIEEIAEDNPEYSLQ